MSSLQQQKRGGRGGGWLNPYSHLVPWLQTRFDPGPSKTIYMSFPGAGQGTKCNKKMRKYRKKTNSPLPGIELGSFRF